MCAGRGAEVALFAGGDSGKPPSNDPSAQRYKKALDGWSRCRATMAAGARTAAKPPTCAKDEHLESNGNDVANTAVAALALRRAGKQYQPAM